MRSPPDRHALLNSYTLFFCTFTLLLCCSPILANASLLPQKTENLQLKTSLPPTQKISLEFSPHSV